MNAAERTRHRDRALLTGLMRGVRLTDREKRAVGRALERMGGPVTDRQLAEELAGDEGIGPHPGERRLLEEPEPG